MGKNPKKPKQQENLPALLTPLTTPTPKERDLNRKRKGSLVDYFLSFPRGSVVTWEEIAEVCGVDDRATLTDYIIDIRKTMIKEHGYFIANIRDEGYKILEGDEHRLHISAQWRNYHNNALHCDELIDHVDRGALTARENQLLDEEQRIIRSINGVLMKAIKSVDRETRKELQTVRFQYPEKRV